MKRSSKTGHKGHDHSFTCGKERAEGESNPQVVETLSGVLGMRLTGMGESVCLP